MMNSARKAKHGEKWRRRFRGEARVKKNKRLQVQLASSKWLPRRRSINGGFLLGDMGTTILFFVGLGIWLVTFVSFLFKS